MFTPIKQPPENIDPRAIIGNPNRPFLNGPPAWTAGLTQDQLVPIPPLWIDDTPLPTQELDIYSGFLTNSLYDQLVNVQYAMDYQLTQQVKIYAYLYNSHGWDVDSIMQSIANSAGQSFNYDGTVYTPVALVVKK